MAKPHALHNEGTENIFIAVPKNLFLLLIVGVLIIAAVLTYQFVYIPAKETAIEKAAEMRVAEVQAKQADEAITAAKKNENVRILANAGSEVIKKEPILHSLTSLEGLHPNSKWLEIYNQFDGPKQMVGLQWDKMYGIDKLDGVLFLIKKGGHWTVIGL